MKFKRSELAVMARKSRYPCLLWHFENGIICVNKKFTKIFGYELHDDKTTTNDTCGSDASALTNWVGYIFKRHIELSDGGKALIPENIICKNGGKKNVNILYEYGDDDYILLYFIDSSNHESELMYSQKNLLKNKLFLDESYHRFKNNLKSIDSLLLIHSQISNQSEVKKVLNECCNRVKSMTAVHELMCKAKNLISIDLEEYTNSLVYNLIKSYGKIHAISLEIDIANIQVDVNIATTYGLVLNEILMNSLTHAFPNDRKGVISITLKVGSGRNIILFVSDNGVGFIKPKNLTYQHSFGLAFIHELVEQQLGGQITLTTASNTGTQLEIKFPTNGGSI